MNLLAVVEPLKTGRYIPRICGRRLHDNCVGFDGAFLIRRSCSLATVQEVHVIEARLVTPTTPLYVRNVPVQRTRPLLPHQHQSDAPIYGWSRTADLYADDFSCPAGPDIGTEGSLMVVWKKTRCCRITRLRCTGLSVSIFLVPLSARAPDTCP